MTVRDLFSSKDKWTKEKIARDKNGKSVDFLSPAAYSFCLIGAVRKCYPDGYRAIEYRILTYLFSKGISCGVSGFNDNSEFQDIMKLVNDLGI